MTSMMPEAHREALNVARQRLRSAETDMQIAHHDWERAFEKLREARRQVEMLEKFGPRDSVNSTSSERPK